MNYISMEKVNKLAELIQKETFDRYMTSFPNESLATPASRTKVIPGQKYVKVDVGSSGKYMIELSTGIIYGIKGYGVIHKGHSYGTLDTINDYYWGEYTAFKKSETFRIRLSA